MVLRIFFKAWRVSIRTTRRFIVFLVAYAILLTWIAFIVRQYYITLFTPPVNPDVLTYYMVIIGWTLVAGTIMGIIFSWLLAHGRRDDIATLKCVGWSNHDVRELVLGEVIFITIAAVIAIAVLGVLATGIYASVAIMLSFDPLGNTVIFIPDALRLILINPLFMLISFGAVMLVQLPGILILLWRSLRISPMRALTRPE
jgi:ABC-type antimicrobial peptide transport system permease subunit